MERFGFARSSVQQVKSSLGLTAGGTLAMGDVIGFCTPTTVFVSCAGNSARGICKGQEVRGPRPACARAAAKMTATPPPVEYGGLQHVGMLVENTEVAKKFYMDVLGMQDDHALRNPKLPFGGTFVRCGGSQVHLMELPSVDPKTGRPDHGGRDKHAAITVKDLDPLIESLEKNNVTYTFSQSGRRAVFVRDLDMNALEFVEDPSV